MVTVQNFEVISNLM